MCVSLARVPPPLPPMAGSHEQAHEHARVLGSVPLSTFNSCVVPINPCPMSMFTSSSSSFSPLSRGLEHQTQLPTPVTPIPCTASLYSLRTRARAHTHTHTQTHTHTRPRCPRVHFLIVNETSLSLFLSLSLRERESLCLSLLESRGRCDDVRDLCLVYKCLSAC